MRKFVSVRQEVSALFEQYNIDLFDVDVLISEVLNVPLSKLFLLEKINENSYKRIMNYAQKRCGGVPITKLFKRAYFYGLEFYVNNNVLSPRQETELLVENALKIIKTGDKVLDLCTGSGAIAISLAKNCDAQIMASDISPKALYVAKRNAKKLSADIKFIKSNMFDKIDEQFDIIVSNPPYIASDDVNNLEREVKDYDPTIALDGGKDGLDFYKIIVSESPKRLKENGTLILEIGFNQYKDVEKLLKSNNFDTILMKDYSGNDRIVIAKLRKKEK